MRTSLLNATLIALLFTTSTTMHAEEKGGMAELRWMLGNWISAGEKSTTRESWKEVGANAFQGTGNVTSKKDDNVLQSEALLLVEMSGEVFYLAKVKENQYPVPFKLTASSANHAVFENPTHDFPKKLEYRLTGKSKLSVTVSDGAARSFTIPFSQ